jgi:hypothetical protein
MSQRRLADAGHAADDGDADARQECPESPELSLAPDEERRRRGDRAL